MASNNTLPPARFSIYIAPPFVAASHDMNVIAESEVSELCSWKTPALSRQTAPAFEADMQELKEAEEKSSV